MLSLAVAEEARTKFIMAFALASSKSAFLTGSKVSRAQPKARSHSRQVMKGEEQKQGESYQLVEMAERGPQDDGCVTECAEVPTA